MYLETRNICHSNAWNIPQKTQSNIVGINKQINEEKLETGDNKEGKKSNYITKAEIEPK